MIELELKFELTCVPEIVSTFPQNYIKHQQDVYYDTDDFKLIRNGNFLRIRNNRKMDFKVDIDDVTHLYCRELSFDIEEIALKIKQINDIFKLLDLFPSPKVNNIEQFIKKNRLQVLAAITKKRTAYSLNNNLSIFIDEVENLGTFMEAEIMIDSDSLSQTTAETIKEKAINELIERGILKKEFKMVNVGYVELFLLKYNKNAYDLGKFRI